MKILNISVGSDESWGCLASLSSWTQPPFRTTGMAGGRLFLPARGSSVTELHDVAVGHHVVLAFEADPAFGPGAGD
jgi:hypothetical protein